jgi:hypothetical protein
MKIDKAIDKFIKENVQRMPDRTLMAEIYKLFGVICSVYHIEDVRNAMMVWRKVGAGRELVKEKLIDVEVVRITPAIIFFNKPILNLRGTVMVDGKDILEIIPRNKNVRKSCKFRYRRIGRRDIGLGKAVVKMVAKEAKKTKSKE